MQAYRRGWRAGLAALSLAASAACGGNTGPAEVATDAPLQVQLAQAFTLAPGETATMGAAGPYLTFKEVSSDSRCPMDVVCIWMGDAVVVLDVGSPSGWLVGDLHTDPQQPPLDFGEYRIRLTNLQPYPSSAQQIRPEQYRATFEVTRP